MTNNRNRTTPVQTGNISAAVSEILKQEGIYSDDLATKISLLDSRRQTTNRTTGLRGLNPIAKFEQILENAKEFEVFDTFIQQAWGTSQGTFGATELFGTYNDALSNSNRQQNISIGLNNERSNVDFVDFYLGRELDFSITSNYDNILKSALSYETGGDNSVDALNYFVFKSNTFDPGGHNADALSVWLRGIPSTDLARAYPFVRVSILQSKSSANVEGVNDYVPTMSWDFSLKGGTSLRNQTAWVEEEETAQLFRRAVRNARSGETENSSETSVYKALPDVMNAPQTYLARAEDVLNPMAPQLGLLNLSVKTESSGYGLISKRTASMALKLFDRSRLSDIAPLIAPTYRGSVAFEIEWGWKCDIADNVHTPYTRFIDQLRTKEYYSLSSPNFSFNDDGSVNIDLRLHLRTSDLMEKLDISVGALSAGATDDSENIAQLEETLRNLAERLTGLISSATPDPSNDLAVTASPVVFLGRFTSADSILNIRDGDPVIQEIKDFIDAYSGESVGGSSTAATNTPGRTNTLDQIVNLLKDIFGSYSAEERAERFRSRSAGSGGRSPAVSGGVSRGDSSTPRSSSAEEAVARHPTTFNPATFGQMVIEAARAEIGVSAQGPNQRPPGNRRSPRVDQYNLFVGGQSALGQNWCGAFVSWVLNVAASHCGGRTIKSGGATRMFQRAFDFGDKILTFTPDDVSSGRQIIQPGDVYVTMSPDRDRENSRGSVRTPEWYQNNLRELRAGRGTPVLGHVGFCVGGYNPPGGRQFGKFGTIDGNSGGRVREKNDRDLDPAKIVGFFRILQLGEATTRSAGSVPGVSPADAAGSVSSAANNLSRQFRRASSDSAIGKLRTAISDAVRKRIDQLYALPENIPDEVSNLLNQNRETVSNSTRQRSGNRRVYSPAALNAAFLMFRVGMHEIENNRLVDLDELYEYASTFLEVNDLEGFNDAFRSFPKVNISDTRSNRISVANGRLPSGYTPNLARQNVGVSWNDYVNSGFNATFDTPFPSDVRNLARRIEALQNFCKNIGRRNSRIERASNEQSESGQRNNRRNLASAVGDVVEGAVGASISNSSQPDILTNWQRSLDPWMFDFIQTHKNPSVQDVQGVDPFSEDNLGGKPFWEGGGDKLWTSFGRIFGFFVGIPLSTKANSQTSNEIFNEIQVFWHSFNSNAAWYANQPVCNFLIEKGELQQVFADLFATSGMNVPILTLMTAINDQIIRNPASASYGFDRFYEPGEEGTSRKVKEEFSQNSNVLQREKNALLTRSYTRFGSNASPEWSPPNLSLQNDIKDRLDNPESTQENDKIVRLTMRDDAANRWSGLARILQSARVTDPRLPTTTDLAQASWNDGPAREIIGYITNSDEAREHGIDLVRDETTGFFRVKGGFRRLKELYRKVMPTVIYGGEGTTVTSAKFTSVDNSAIASMQIMRNITGVGLSPNQAKQSGLPLRVSPSRVQFEMLGFPFFGYSQYFFADFNTGTTVDNIYMATSITNEISPGKFTTSIEGMAPEDAYSRFESPLNALTRAAAIINERNEREEREETGDLTSQAIGAASNVVSNVRSRLNPGNNEDSA